MPCEQINLDFERFNEYTDSAEHPAEQLFENPRLPNNKTEVQWVNPKTPTILKYFLDGSRKTYKVSDVIVGGRFLPIIGGQVGVALMERKDTQIVPKKKFCSFRNVIALPDKLSNEDISYLQDKLNEALKIKFELMRYRVKPNQDPIQSGIAKIMSEMQNLEIQTVTEMANEHLLSNDKLLVIDGTLRFEKNFDIVQFRNVVGIAKTFRPSCTFGKGRNRVDVGSLTSRLKFGERTSVFKFDQGKKTIGMWYLRIRPTMFMSNSLQGITKIECYAVDPEEKETGFDRDRVNVISGHILRERNVTPYKSDFRWATHIYPIFLAETFIKSCFLSDTHFKALF